MYINLKLSETRSQTLLSIYIMYHINTSIHINSFGECSFFVDFFKHRLENEVLKYNRIPTFTLSHYTQLIYQWYPSGSLVRNRTIITGLDHNSRHTRGRLKET